MTTNRTTIFLIIAILGLVFGNALTLVKVYGDLAACRADAAAPLIRAPTTPDKVRPTGRSL